MNNKKLICPVKRINKTSVDLKVDLEEEQMKINIDINTKNILKSLISFINNKWR